MVSTQPRPRTGTASHPDPPPRGRRDRRCRCGRDRGRRRAPTRRPPRWTPPNPTESAHPVRLPASARRAPCTPRHPQPHRNPGTAAATRSRSGKPPQDPMLIGLTRPLCRSIGPAEAIPTPPTAPPPRRARRRSSRRPRPRPVRLRHTPGWDVGRCAPTCRPGRPGPRRSWCRRCRGKGCISAGGCCRVGAGRRGAHSRGPAPPGRSGARPATPGRRGGARPPTDAR